MRKRQFIKWLERPVRHLLVTDVDRKCIRNKGLAHPDQFSLSQDILGQDCALDLTNIDSICRNLQSFFLWAYDDCRGKILAERAHVLRSVCERIQRIQATRIHPNRRN